MIGRRHASRGVAAAPRAADAPAGGADARLARDVSRFLRLREHTQREVRDYLTRRGHAPELIGRCLSELVATGLVDDRRFAAMLLRDRQRLRPVGRAAVLRELAVRGVARQVAQEVLATSDPPWDDLELAVQALQRRWARWPAARRRESALRFLRARGFGVTAIRAALARAASEE